MGGGNVGTCGGGMHEGRGRGREGENIRKENVENVRFSNLESQVKFELH